MEMQMSSHGEHFGQTSLPKGEGGGSVKNWTYVNNIILVPCSIILYQNSYSYRLITNSYFHWSIFILSPWYYI